MRQALASALAKKASLDELKVIADLEVKAPKTKDVAKTIQNLVGGRSALLVLANKNSAALRASANLRNVDSIPVRNLNAFNVLAHKTVIMEQAAMQELAAQVK